MSMFCRQCEQTAGGKGCTVQGVCGKTAQTAGLLDVLVQSLKSIAVYSHAARQLGAHDAAVDRYIAEGLFTTITNVNFDDQALAAVIARSRDIKRTAERIFTEAYHAKHGTAFAGQLPVVAAWQAGATLAEQQAQAASVGILADGLPDDVQSLRELILYGLKGMAAYADHAAILGHHSEAVDAFLHKGLDALARTELSADTLTAILMDLGKANLACMELLDKANHTTFGVPVPTAVALGVKKGPAILVSGHDLLDLKMLLEQTAGTGIQVYTHGEMLPAHGYPELHKYPHLAGHYGTAWQNQQKEFAAFPGAILMTTNCIQRPAESYKGALFTTGLVGWPGVAHIDAVNGKKDFSAVIAAAKRMQGFPADAPAGTLMTGFAHEALLAAAGTVIEAVKSGALKHIFLIGGCDGAKPGRNYYTEFAQKTPANTVVLTLACGKFRFNRHDFGTLGSLPRLLDVGQCNDAYSAIVVAAALAKAFGTDVNGLPLSLILSWYEQKAVAILITLLSLGIKNIRLGPTLPAFVTPGILKFLVDKFQIKPVSTPEADLKEILG